MKTQDFDYILPPSFIAQSSVNPRDHARLFVLDRNTGERMHRRFFEIEDCFRSGDVLVFNDSKVFPARLHGIIQEKPVEIFLLRCKQSCFTSSQWEILAKPGRFLQENIPILLSPSLSAHLLKKRPQTYLIEIAASEQEVLAFAHMYGSIPIPPYVDHIPKNSSDYQTIYAKTVGSVAAPTAGFHFTESLLQRLKSKGIQMEFVTLHVGLGTFLPVKTQVLEDHVMHQEYVQIEKETAQRLKEAKREGRRIIAVGTTSVRVLEGVFLSFGELQSYAGDLTIFIKPGFTFRVIDGLITNFHLPKSTLLALVSAFAGRETILSCYEEAKEKGYRFFSFGDAMFIG